MPFLALDNRSVYYRLDGADDLPVLVLSHSLGLDHGMWEPQAADLLRHFQILRYDIRGHGASTATPGDYSVADLSQDVLALADGCGIRQFAFCGLSLGGMIGQWLGVHAPERITHLVLANTTSRLVDRQPMEDRRRTVLEQGMAAVADVVMTRFFSPTMLASGSPYVASARRTLLATHPVGYAGCCAAIRDVDQTALLAGIRTPTLVIGGDADGPMPWAEHGEKIATAIPGARSVRLPAGHISNLERPRSFTAALLNFLVPRPADHGEAGLAVRRAALGDDYVARAMASASDLTRGFQELITRYAWGSIWTRPGLDRRTRRLLVLSTAAALGRWEEFRLHLRAGLAGEIEPCDVEEVLLQLAIYAGVPAANTAFHIASEEMGYDPGRKSAEL
jgi:3-oxoadipate enol-lactonase/4-carboxymuconolactone decarboxylase